MITKNSLLELGKNIEREELTTQEILSCGFTKHDIPKLLENNIIKRKKRGYYEISYEYILEIGKRELTHKDYDSAKKIFEKLYTLDANNLEVIYALFKMNIVNGSLNDIIKYYMSLCNVMVSREDRKILNLYLFLINQYLPLPSVLKEKAENLLLNDLADFYPEGNAEYIIAKNLYQGDYKKAHSLIHMNASSQKFEPVLLFIQAIAKNQSDLKTTLEEYTRAKNYRKIYLTLRSIQNVRKLSYEEDIIFLLIKKLCFFPKETKLLPQVGIPHNETLRSYVKANRFSEARDKFEMESDYSSLIRLLLLENELLLRKKSMEFGLYTKDDFNSYLRINQRSIVDDEEFVLIDMILDKEREELDVFLQEHDNIQSFTILEEGKENIVLYPRETKTLNQYEKDLIYRQIKLALENEDYVTYISLYKKLLISDPENESYYFKIADAYFKSGNYRKSLKYLRILKGICEKKNIEKPGILELIKGAKVKIYRGQIEVGK